VEILVLRVFMIVFRLPILETFWFREILVSIGFGIFPVLFVRVCVCVCGGVILYVGISV